MTRDPDTANTPPTRLLAAMQPVLHAGTYLFASAAAGTDIDTRDCLCVPHDDARKALTPVDAADRLS